MKVTDHSEDPTLTFGWGLRRYLLDGEEPVVVVDTIREIAKPADEGLSISSGSFDLRADATVYVGLSAPFIVPDTGADLYRAFPSAADVTVDHLLQPGGGRSTTPADSFVPGDNDLWSIGNG